MTVNKTYYHGTTKNFTEFKPVKGNTSRRVNNEIESNKSFWFSNTKHAVEFFANGGVRTPKGVLYPDAKIIEVNLIMNNPLIIDMANAFSFAISMIFEDKQIYDIALIKEQKIKFAKNNDYDSVIFKNAYDFSPFGNEVVAVFKPEQIIIVN